MGVAGNHPDAQGRVSFYRLIEVMDTSQGMGLVCCFDGWAVGSLNTPRPTLYERLLSVSTAQLPCSHKMRILRIYSQYLSMLGNKMYAMRSMAGGRLPSITSKSLAPTGTIPIFLVLGLRFR